MATYKVLQDIEAEDKLVGPLTLWQFIYFLGAALCVYLGAISVLKGVPFFLIFLAPVALFLGFLAIPWGGEQPTEVWALAKLRFFLKPRRRVWDQAGMTELVTVTAPKQIERVFTDGLSQTEVKSRLHALASTLDSRGWAVKNVNINMVSAAPSYSASDRLIDVSSGGAEVPAVDIKPDDDILDESANPIAHTFDTMIDRAASEYRKALVDRMNQPLPSSGHQSPSAGFGLPTSEPVAEQTQPIQTPTQDASQPTAAPGFWFTSQPTAQTDTPAIDTPDPSSTDDTASIPHAGEPTDEEKALLSHLKDEESQQTAVYGHLKTLKTPEQIEEEERETAAQQAEIERQKQAAEAERRAAEAAMTSEKQAAIINLSRTNDFNIDTIARQAKQELANDDEVVVPLR